MTSGPSHPRPGGSSAQHCAPLPSPTPPPPPSSRSAPRPKRNAIRPANSQSSHPRPTEPPPTRGKQRQGPPAAPPPPYQPSMSADIQQMPRYRRQRESQPNPEAETVRAYPRVHIRPRPRSPRIPTAQDYDESLRPATATSPHNPITPTNAHPSAQGHGPAQGSRRGGGCHRPHGKPCWPMRSTPWESTPQPPRAPGPPVCPQAPVGDSTGDGTGRQTPVGHHPKPKPAHTNPPPEVRKSAFPIL